MRFIHSNKQYIERTMYPINPYMNAPAVVPLTMEAFVAPADFDQDAQELNIVKAFAAYQNANKKYIFSVGTSTTTVLPAVNGRSYSYAENGGAYTTISSGTITWSVGSIKRNVVVIDSASSIIADIAIGGVWCYASDKVYSFYSPLNTSFKYIHCQNRNSITIAGYTALSGCTGLKGNVTFGNSLTAIESYAFNNCTGLIGDVIIPNSVYFLGSTVFHGCSGLNSKLTIGTGVGSISDNFLFNTYFSIITGGNSFYSVSNNILYLGALGFERGCIGASKTLSLTNLVLPNTVTSIYENAFLDCIYLTGVLTIGNNVTDIARYSFSGCTGLTGLNIGNSVITIGDHAFYNCYKILGSLIIPDSVISIGTWAFAYCSGFTSLIIGNGVKTIGDVAFSVCTGLSTVTIGNSVITIGPYALNNLTSLSRLNIYALSAPSAANAFYSYGKPLHIKSSGTNGYNVAPWTNPAIFSNIIADL